MRESNLEKISIVTISYNQAEFIEECIGSVLTQEYDNLEYIIVDPGSTDSSRTIVDKYRDRINKIIFEPDCGPADGLNKGFRLATGEIFGYINADDILLPRALSIVANFFATHPNIDVVCGNGLQLNRSGKITRKLHSNRWSLKRHAFRASDIVQPATFFRRNVFFRAGGFNITNQTCWDSELLVDMALAGANFTRINKFLGGFRLYNESITGSGRLHEQTQLDYMRIYTKVFGKPAGKSYYFLKYIHRAIKILGHPDLIFNKLMYRIKQFSQ